MRLTALAAMLGFASFLFAKEEKPVAAEEALKAGLATAKKESKKVFLEFGYEGCVWCRILDKYHADDKVKPILAKHFVFVHIDIVKQEGGKEMNDKFGQKGSPSWAVLDGEGKSVIDSAADGRNVGYPNKPHEREHYVKVLKMMAPTMGEEEIKTLLERLEHYGKR